MRKPVIIVIDRNKFRESDIAIAIEAIRRGGLVIYPTDTVYGLGADPLNEDAVRKVYEAKKRILDKPLPVLAYSLRDVERIAILNEVALRLSSMFWPGPLTLILPSKGRLPCIVTGCRKAIGVRIPKDNVTLSLIKGVGGLLIGTSANISGHEAPRTANEAIQQVGSYVDIVIDAGPTIHGTPSTVVDLTMVPPRITRKGALADKVEEALRNIVRA